MLPDGADAVIDRRAWTVPPIFQWLQRTGDVPDDDMLRTFNMGIGLIVVCAPETRARADRRRWPRRASRGARAHWTIEDGGRGVQLPVTASVAGTASAGDWRPDLGPRQQPAGAHRRHRATASSTRGSRSSSRTGRTPAGWIARARPASRRWCSIIARSPTRDDYDAAPGAGTARAPRLAGLSRRLHAPDRRAAARRVPERILNMHPSLLPAFPGVDAQRRRSSTA